MRYGIVILLLAALSPDTYAQRPNWLDSGLVAFYGLDSLSGADSTVHGNDLAGPSGSVLGMHDRWGNAQGAALFGSGGVPGYMRGTVSDLPFGQSPRSFSLWMNPQTIPDFNLQYAFVFFYGRQQNNEGMGLGFHASSSVLFAGYVNDLHPSDIVPVGQWTHIGMTYDGNMAHLYVDGVVIASSAFPAWDTQSGSLHIGLMGVTGGGGQTGGTSYILPYEGGVDDFRIYDRVLSAGEVEQLAKDSFYVASDTVLTTLPDPYNQSPEVRLFPNPASEQLNLDWPGMEAVPFRIYGLTGQVWTEGMIQPGSNSIPVASWPAGYYILEVDQQRHRWIKTGNGSLAGAQR